MGRKSAYFEGLILIPVVLLIGFSLAVIGSIYPELLPKQLSYFIIGLLVFIILAFIDTRIIQNLSLFFYCIALVTLLGSYFGPSVRGATRWIEIGGMRIQPSELVQPLFLIVQASFLASPKPWNFKRLCIYFVLFGLPLVLVFKQPDLGNSIIYAGSMLGLLFLSGAPIVYFPTIFGIGALFVPLVWKILKEYQKVRFLSFLNPYIDTAGVGYNAIQAMISIGSGQLFGRGLGRGPQSQLRFLPENHTDFIFASFTEELGFVAALLLIVIYCLLLFTILRRAKSIPDRFSQILISGAFLQIFLHVVINIGMNIGLLPITGITLPLISFGGSSVIATLLLLGLVNGALRQHGKFKKTIAIA